MAKRPAVAQAGNNFGGVADGKSVEMLQAHVAAGAGVARYGVRIELNPGPAPMLMLQSPNYELRSLTAEDAALDWGWWIADTDTALAINAVPRELSVGERAAFIARIDNRDNFLLGIFGKAAGELVGIWTIYCDPETREYLLSVLVGAGKGRNHGALTETREPIYVHFFEVAGMESARVNVLASNSYVMGRLLRQAWVHEHTSLVRGADGKGEVEVCHLRMTREAWRAYMRER